MRRIDFGFGRGGCLFGGGVRVWVFEGREYFVRLLSGEDGID